MLLNIPFLLTTHVVVEMAYPTKKNLPLTFSNPKQSFSALNMRQGQTFSYGDFEQKGNSNGTQGFYRIDCYI